MLNYVHQVAANCVCLLFGNKQVGYKWFFGVFLAKKEAIRAVRWNQNYKVANWTETELTVAVKL